MDTDPLRNGPNRSRGGDLADRQVNSLMRAALIWACGAAVIVGLFWLAAGPHHVGDLLGSLVGSALALVYLYTGRSIHLLVGGGSFAGAMMLFLMQIAVLAMLGEAVLRGNLLARLGTGPVPMASSTVVIALAWTVGVVVAGRHPNQRIYQDRENQ
ncbi:MAG: hypothetical protein LKI24_06225 [Acidipropionibacterium sp.]|nr:hypothetical protein [Acidipropionibacterium sp.]